jgi:hypothetical protein
MTSTIQQTESATAHVDRILGLSDQFLEDWKESDKNDPERIERQKEYDDLRPLLVVAPLMLSVLKKIYPGLEFLPDGAFRIVRTYETRRDWICVIQPTRGDSWVVQHNDTTESFTYPDLSEALDVSLKFVPEEQ